MWTLTVTVVQPMNDRERMRIRLDGRKPDGSHVCTLHTTYGQLGGHLSQLERVHGECELVLPRE